MFIDSNVFNKGSPDFKELVVSVWQSISNFFQVNTGNYIVQPFLKQGGEADFQSLRITCFAMTIPNTRACCSDEGRVSDNLDQPNIIRRLSGVNCLLYMTLYKWKMSCQKILSLGQEHTRWTIVLSSDLSQVAETEGKILINLGAVINCPVGEEILCIALSACTPLNCLANNLSGLSPSSKCFCWSLRM